MKEWQTRKKLPPVLLLTGQPGIGKRSVTYFLAQWILCEKGGFNHSSLQPCNECLACQRIAAHQETDLIEILSENEEETGSLKIEQFRKLKTSAGFGVLENRHKTILIPNADRMTLQAANSVLKLLEETPPGWVFFLTANDSTLLLPTLVSRCQVIRLKPFSTEQIRALLSEAKIDPIRQEVCADLAQGSWLRAIHFASDEVWERRNMLLRFFENPSSVTQAIMDWGAQDFSHLETLLDLMEQFNADLIRWTAQAEKPLLAELSTHAKGLIRKTGSLDQARSFWIQQAENLAQARHESLLPINRKLLIQNLLFPWIGAAS